MGKLIDITGQKFNKLTVISRAENQGKNVMWNCQCECGNTCIVRGSYLRNGHTKSCGCKIKEAAQEVGMHNGKNLIGQKFGRLTVVSKSKTINNHTKWHCICDCGNECDVFTTNLLQGMTTSCGCYKYEQISQAHKINIIGQKFGKLTVLEEAGKDADGSYNYLCQCECGKLKIINGVSLRTNVTTSCGCINYSIGEKNIVDLLELNNISYCKEYKIAELNNARYDFAILKNNNIIRLIEFDGIQHYEKSNSIWESQVPLEERQERDKIKNQWAKDHNIPLVRIPYWERDNITLEMIMGDQYLIK